MLNLKMNALLALIFSFLVLGATELPKDVFIVDGCSVYDNTVKLVSNYPGDMCIFLEDGKIISANSSGIRQFSRDKEILWEIAGNFHHQMNLTSDRQKVLSLMSKVRKSPDGTFREDWFGIFSIDGKLLHEVRALDLLKTVPLPVTTLTLPPEDKIKSGADFEETHFNSIYEVPKNKSKLSYLKSGNIIVNSYGYGTCILTPDLKTVLNCQRFSDSINHATHDVQVNFEGNFFFFNNEVPGPNHLRSSSVDEFDPVKKKIVYRFQSVPAVMFYSPICGGVQELPDRTFFVSHMQVGGFIIDRKKKALGHIPYHGLNKTIRVVQQLKLRRLKL